MSSRTIIEWVSIQDKECLRFRFNGHLNVSEACRAVAEWKKMMSSRPDARVVLIWDCINMLGYDSDARKLWTKALKEVKHQTKEIWVITNSSIIRMGAGIIAMTSHIKTKVIDSEDQIFSV